MRLFVYLPLELIAGMIIKKMGLAEEDFPSRGSFFLDAGPKPPPCLQFGNHPLSNIFKRARVRYMCKVEPIDPCNVSPPFELIDNSLRASNDLRPRRA